MFGNIIINLPADEKRHTLVEKQIMEELSNGRYVMAPRKPRIISALGAVDKPSKNKIRLIHDCSRPEGSALNDLAVNWKFSYQSIQDAISIITPSCFFWPKLTFQMLTGLSKYILMILKCQV